MIKRYMDKLFDMAQEVPICGQARIVACVVYKKKVVSYGKNSYKSHPFHQKFKQREGSIYLHAETDAIKNAIKVIGEDALKKSTLYICRAKYNDHSCSKFVHGIAKPCSGCQKAIDEYNIKNVIYSTDIPNEFEKL
jgi:deoxycytidylate deaminase